MGQACPNLLVRAIPLRFLSPGYQPNHDLAKPLRIEMAVLTVREIVISYHDVHECVRSRGNIVTLQEAGAAFRRLRRRRGWTLDYLEERTGLRAMTLSHLERGNMTPRPSTLARLDSGMGWPPGTFVRLAQIHGGPEVLDATLDRLMDDPWAEARPATLPVRQASEVQVLENYAEAYMDTLNEAIRKLPDPTSARSQPSTLATLAQCAKAEVLVANAWRVASVTDPGRADRLFAMLRDLEGKRHALLARIATSLPGRVEQACRKSDLPEALIAAMTGVSSDELWQIRTEGVIPDGVNTRIAAFLKAVDTHGS
jgi:transcriptional regulator with XRE-family HTH domain